MTRDLHRAARPGLYCVELRTENWAQLVDWYRDVLGLRVLVRVVDEGYALLEAGETRLALLARESVGEASRRFSLAFEVEDIAKVCTRLETAGMTILYPVRDPEGLREANTLDPEGNRIRLFSWPSR
jgi:catechol 2,3-dioxygenase-like lactoylglutathione lyase family enzyme